MLKNMVFDFRRRSRSRGRQQSSQAAWSGKRLGATKKGSALNLTQLAPSLNQSTMLVETPTATEMNQTICKNMRKDLSFQNLQNGSRSKEVAKMRKQVI